MFFDESGYYYAEDGSLTAEERREMTLVNLTRSKASKAKRKKQRRQKAAEKKVTEAERRAKEQQRIKEEREKRRSMSEANRRGAGLDPAAEQKKTTEGESEFLPPEKVKPASSDEKSIDIALPGEKKKTDSVKKKAAAKPARTAEQTRAKAGRFSAAASAANPNRITAGSAVMFGLLTTVLIGIVIYGRVQTNEAYTEIAKLQAEYDDLVTQNISMKSEMDGKMTVKNIEDYAQNVLGLKPLNQSQIEYIQLQTEDEVVITKPKESFFVKVNDYLTRFWEFLSGK